MDKFISVEKAILQLQQAEEAGIKTIPLAPIVNGRVSFKIEYSADVDTSATQQPQYVGIIFLGKLKDVKEN